MKIKVWLMVTLAILGLSVFAQEATHFIGEKFGGGIVFYVTPNGQHGLIVESIDQATNIGILALAPSIEGAARFDIGDPQYSSEDGKNYTDWRLPNFYELNLLFQVKKEVGSFSKGSYLYTTYRLPDSFFVLEGFDFDKGKRTGTKVNVRLIRSF